jgi:phosphoglycerol transferase
MWVSLGFLACAVGLLLGAVVSRTGAILAAGAVLAGLLLSVAYAVIDRLTGSGIDASVIYHLKTGLAGADLASFSGLAAGAVMAVLASLLAAGLAYRLFQAKAPVSFGAGRILLGLALLLGSIAIHPATGDLARLASGIRMAAAPAGPAPPGFVAVEKASFASPPRNFVLLYIESVERSYLDEARFPGLMPNLAALEAEAVSFTDLTEVGEAGWTIAGMVASQCGMPLVGSGAGVDRFLPGATCLGDLLAREGFDLAYVGGADLDFAGKGTFYDSHGFSLVEGRTELEPRLSDPKYVNDWGLYDDSLYPEVRRRLDTLAKAGRPFGLVALTLDTHHPYGFASRSCAEQPYGDGSNQFLNAVHCADRLAADFIGKVRAHPAFANTVLVVASDHLAMPNLAQDALEAGPRRNLLMVFAPDLAPARIDTPGTTLDIGPTLLGLIGAPTPALGYGRDLLAEAPTLRLGEPGLEALIDGGRSYLAAMWSYPQLTGGLTVDVAAGEVVLGDRRLKFPVLFRLDDTLATSGIDFEASDDLALIERVAGLAVDQRFVWVDACARTAIFAAAPAPDEAGLCLLAGTLASPDLFQIAVKDGVAIPPETLTTPFTHGTAAATMPDPQLADLLLRRQFAAAKVIDYAPSNGSAGEVAIRSAGYLTGASWVESPGQGERVRLMRGLTLLGLAPDAAPVKLGHVDTCGYGGRQPDAVALETGFQAAIDAARERFEVFAIVGHNSVVCYEVDPGLEPLFAGTGLTKWRDLWYEEPYVAVISGNGEVAEFTGPPRTALSVRLTDVMAASGSDDQSKLDQLPQIAGADDQSQSSPKPAVRFEAVSSGYGSGESFLRPLEGSEISLKRGVNLLALPTDAALRLLASFDGCSALDTGTPPDPAPFHAALVTAMAEGKALAILVHDSAFCEGTAIAPLFAGTPLTEAPKIGFRQPYVALIDSDGRVLEFTGPEGTQLREILTVEAMR